MTARVSQTPLGVDLRFVPLQDRVEDKEIRAKLDQLQDKQGKFCKEVTTINNKKILALLRANDKLGGQSIHTILGQVHSSKHLHMPLFHYIDPSYNDAEALTFTTQVHLLSQANMDIKNILKHCYDHYTSWPDIYHNRPVNITHYNSCYIFNNHGPYSQPDGQQRAVSRGETH
jgi:hypothetical protein